jgi:hypothetical protein
VAGPQAGPTHRQKECGGMARFMVVYRAQVSAVEKMANADPAQAQAGMDAWMAWAKEAGEAIVDLGMPLGGGGTSTARKRSRATPTRRATRSCRRNRSTRPWRSSNGTRI